MNNVCIPTRGVLLLCFHDRKMVCPELIEPKTSSGGRRAAEKWISRGYPPSKWILYPVLRILLRNPAGPAHCILGYMDTGYSCIADTTLSKYLSKGGIHTCIHGYRAIHVTPGSVPTSDTSTRTSPLAAAGCGCRIKVAREKSLS